MKTGMGFIGRATKGLSADGALDGGYGRTWAITVS